MQINKIKTGWRSTWKEKRRRLLRILFFFFRRRSPGSSGYSPRSRKSERHKHGSKNRHSSPSRKSQSPRRSPKFDPNSLARQNNMSSTSLFAELVKSKKNRQKIQDKLSKESGSADRGRELSEVDSGTAPPVAAAPVSPVLSQPPPPVAVPSIAAVLPPYSSGVPNATTLSNGGAKLQEEACNHAEAMEAHRGNTPEPGMPESSLKKTPITSLTKLPLPPGFNLEDIDSPTSPSTPPDKRPHRISITKDLPMPPCEYVAPSRD